MDIEVFLLVVLLVIVVLTLAWQISLSSRPRLPVYQPVRVQAINHPVDLIKKFRSDHLL